MVQLWVSLPANEKDAAPGFQALRNREISALALPENADLIACDAEFVLLDRHAGAITLTTNGDVALLILSGAPIDEPVVSHGPLAMNRVPGIRDAMAGLQNGRSGGIAAA